MNPIVVLGILVLGLIGWLIALYKKNAIANALNDNAKTKQEVANIQKTVDANNQAIDAEAQKRADEQKKLDEEKAKDVSQKDLIDFFNDKPNK